MPDVFFKIATVFFLKTILPFTKTILNTVASEWLENQSGGSPELRELRVVTIGKLVLRRNCRTVCGPTIRPAPFSLLI